MSVRIFGVALVITLFFNHLLNVADAPIYDIPHVNNITLDGKGDAWSAGAFCVDGLCDSQDTIAPSKEFAVHLRLAWCDEGLVALARVTDPGDDESPSTDMLWKNTCVEFFVTPKAAAPDIWQLLVAPGVSDAFPNLRKHLADNRKSEELKRIPLDADARRVKTADGYIVEALLPWKNLGIKPALGQEIGFQIYVDHMNGWRENHCSWYPKLGAGHDTTLVQRLRLSDHASGPPAPAVWGSYEKFHDTRVNIVSSAELAGKTIEVRQQGADDVLASGKLTPDDGRAIANLTFAMPPAGKPYAPLRVAVEGQTEQTIDLGDPEPGRAAAILDQEIVFKPMIFSGEAFPPGEFAEPVFARDVLGPYTLTTTFFDGHSNKVETAATPGRYGALVDIATADGKHLRRFVTIYRSAKPFDPAEVEKRGPAALADAGIDPRLCEHFKDSITEILKGQTRMWASLPTVVAGLSEIDPAEKRAFTLAWNPSTFDRDYWYGVQKKTGTFAPYHYLEFMPDGYDADKTKSWPLLVILHGSGASGDDLNILYREHAVPETLGEHAKSRPFIVIIPQCRSGEGWNARGVADLIDEVSAKYRVDPDRIYLSGSSRGGFGAWSVAMTIPDRLAALAPVCGGADPGDAKIVKDLPIWIFHGDHDMSVDVDWSNKMFAALSKIGARARYTLYINGTHDITDQTYHDELFQWFLQQRRGQPAQTPTTQPTPVVAIPQSPM